VHVKTLVAQEQRMLLTSRKLLQRKLLDVESDLRGTLRNFGLKVGRVSGSRYEARVRELVEDFPGLAAIAEPLLNVRLVMRQQFAVLHKMLLDTVRGDPVCRRLMTAPGVGAVVALTYRATVDQPQRFAHSRAVGAHVGLTPKRYQSGETDYDGGVSKCGDAPLRTMLYEAAQVLLTHGRKWSWLICGWLSGAGYVEPSSRSPGAWLWFCTGCGSTVASSAGARTAPPLLRLPEPAAESAGKLSARR
jgi:transposase